MNTAGIAPSFDELAVRLFGRILVEQFRKEFKTVPAAGRQR